MLVIIACQRAMHSERDIVLPILSIRLSVQCRYSVKTYRRTSYRAVTVSRDFFGSSTLSRFIDVVRI